MRENFNGHKCSELEEAMMRIGRDYLGGCEFLGVFIPVNQDAMVLAGRMGDRCFQLPISGYEARKNEGNHGLKHLFIRRCMHLQNDLLGWL